MVRVSRSTGRTDISNTNAHTQTHTTPASHLTGPTAANKLTHYSKNPDGRITVGLHFLLGGFGFSTTPTTNINVFYNQKRVTTLLTLLPIVISNFHFPL